MLVPVLETRQRCEQSRLLITLASITCARNLRKIFVVFSPFSVTGLEITGKQQDNLNKWCKKNVRVRGASRLVALFDYGSQRRGKKWRCYKKSALNPEGTAYDPTKKSKQYFTRHKKLTELLGRCKYIENVRLYREFQYTYETW